MDSLFPFFLFQAMFTICSQFRIDFPANSQRSSFPLSLYFFIFIFHTFSLMSLVSSIHNFHSVLTSYDYKCCYGYSFQQTKFFTSSPKCNQLHCHTPHLSPQITHCKKNCMFKNQLVGNRMLGVLIPNCVIDTYQVTQHEQNTCPLSRATHTPVGVGPGYFSPS